MNILKKQKSLIEYELKLSNLERQTLIEESEHGVLTHPILDKGLVQQYLDINEVILMGMYEADQNIINHNFETKMTEYINYLIANKGDISLMDEILEVISEYPHLAIHFEEE